VAAIPIFHGIGLGERCHRSSFRPCPAPQPVNTRRGTVRAVRRRSRQVSAAIVTILLLAGAGVGFVVATRANHPAPTATGSRRTKTHSSTPSTGHPTISSPTTPKPSATSPAPVVVPGPSYTTSGNQILANGTAFVPYGITVFGLSYREWQSRLAGDEAQIDATAQTWHGNTIRIQVAPADLLDAHPYDSAFLNAIRTEVSRAQQDGMNVILTAQDERTTKIPMPDEAVARFWSILAPMYAGDPAVWFDLFNEPRLGGANVPPTSPIWNVWQNGGQKYVGMQSLINEVRRYASNVILVEGLAKAETLSGLPSHPLTGSNLVYAVHPYFSLPRWSTSAGWNKNWGDISEQVPVVVDEWGEYERSGGNCKPDAPRLVPKFLAYLSARNIGLIAWSLEPGVLVVNGNLGAPTSFSPGVPFLCQDGAGIRNGQGAGASILSYFEANSHPVP